MNYVYRVVRGTMAVQLYPIVAFLIYIIAYTVCVKTNLKCKTLESVDIETGSKWIKFEMIIFISNFVSIFVFLIILAKQGKNIKFKLAFFADHAMEE
jgi:hypothetical protein